MPLPLLFVKKNAFRDALFDDYSVRIMGTIGPIDFYHKSLGTITNKLIALLFRAFPAEFVIDDGNTVAKFNSSHCHIKHSYNPCCIHVARIGLVLVSCRRSTVKHDLRNKKASLRVPREAVGIALIETRREDKCVCTYSLQGVVYLETSYISRDDCFAAMQIVFIAP